MSINAVQFQAGSVDAGVLCVLRHRGQVLPRSVQMAVATEISLPLLRWTSALALQARWRHLLPCSACRHQTSLIAGTMFQGTKLTLRTWMLALHLLTSTKTNMAALELMRHLGVNYKTARRMKHKIMQVMTEREDTRRLSGFVQTDDAYLGGKRNGGKAGRGSENKQPFPIAVQIDETFTAPGCVVIEPVRSFDTISLADWTARRPGARSIPTDWPVSAAWKRRDMRIPH